MIAEEIQQRILRYFAHTPTREQRMAIATFADFMADRQHRSVMLLRGSAGTGKTTLSGAIVAALMSMQRRVVLLAPTGRAAKVMSLMASGTTASTIHRKIYRQKAIMGGFQLDRNLHVDTLFIVDEASMIANEGLSETGFGSGHLLDDLIRYVYGGRDCRLMLMGDKAQLPPVGEEESPALSARFVEGYGLRVFQSDLNEVLRQAEGSGILFNATRVRQLITRDQATELPQIRFSGFADIVMMPGAELIESLGESYSRVGLDGTMVITRSNKRANIYNIGIRNSVLGREEMLSSGDRLMIVKNNYFWTDAEKAPMPFLANGDRAVVRRVRNERQLYGFTFVDLYLSFPDYDSYELQATVVVDSLQSEAPALTQSQNEQLYEAVLADYADIPLKADRMKRLRSDIYFNALQIKYAYAATCHKAQGGQWEHVYVDQGYMTDNMLTPDYIHWLYTAFTRATEKLFLVNWPKTQTEGTVNEE